MKITDSLKADISSFGSCYWTNFKKVCDELNFKDNIKCNICFADDDCVKVDFNNHWSITVWNNGKYSIFFCDYKNISTYDYMKNCSFKQLLKFIEKKGIRKVKQCDYKDAELYLVDFGGK